MIGGIRLNFTAYLGGVFRGCILKNEILVNHSVMYRRDFGCADFFRCGRVHHEEHYT